MASFERIPNHCSVNILKLASAPYDSILNHSSTLSKTANREQVLTSEIKGLSLGSEDRDVQAVSLNQDTDTWPGERAADMRGERNKQRHKKKEKEDISQLAL